MTEAKKKQAQIVENNYIKVPVEAENLDIYERSVLFHIIRRCGPQHGGLCYEPVNKAAAAAGMSRRKYLYTIQSLSDKKVISIQKLKGKRSRISWNAPDKWELEIHEYESSAPDAPVHDVHHTSAPDAPLPVHDVHHTGAPDAPPSILVEEDPLKRSNEKDPHTKSVQDSHIDPLGDLLSDWKDHIALRPGVDIGKSWGNENEHRQALSSVIIDYGYTENDIWDVLEWYKSDNCWYDSLLLPKDLVKTSKGQIKFAMLHQSLKKDKKNTPKQKNGFDVLREMNKQGIWPESPF